jgi:hypothetical protein
MKKMIGLTDRQLEIIEVALDEYEERKYESINDKEQNELNLLIEIIQEKIRE